MTHEDLMPVIDALIFASDTPLSLQKIKQLLEEGGHEGVSLKDIRQAVDDINQDNKIQRRGFFLQEVAGGYQFRTRPHYASWVKRLKKAKPFRLTQPTLETLAIIAYRQPIIRAEIEKIRGVDSGGVIKTLLERGLIKIMGRKNIPGRPFLLGTASRFLEVFGLEKLSDLPSLKEFAELDDSKLPTLLRERTGQEFALDEEPEGVGEEQAPATDDDLLQAAQAAAEEAGEDMPDGVFAPGTDAAAGPDGRQEPDS